MGFFTIHAKNFELDASADSLILENDKDLKIFREITKRYDAKDFVKPELIEVDGQVFINPETNIKFSDQIPVGTGSRSLMFNCRGLDFRASFVMPKSAYFMASVLTK